MSPWPRLLGCPHYLYRHGWGWVLGHRALQLTHRGRQTGRLHQTVLEVMRYNSTTGEATVMSGSGPTAHWLRNIQANEQLEVNIGHTFYAATYRLLQPEETMSVLADFERRNILIRPVVHAALSRLGGRHARRTLAFQLPMVAFLPLNPCLKPAAEMQAPATGGSKAH